MTKKEKKQAIKDSSVDGLIISAAKLKENLKDPNLRIIDLRWYLKGKSGLEEYNKGHIPGAIFVDLEKEITAPAGPGRHPIPSAAQLSQLFSRIGATKKTRFVVYDDAGGSVAARFWWLLARCFIGHLYKVEILDGGIQAWSKAGGELSTDIPKLTPTKHAVSPMTEEIIYNKILVSSRMSYNKSGVILFDARAPERYRGEVEPIDARPGHIPGAINAPFADNLNADGTFKTPKELKAHYKVLGVSSSKEVICYCGSGVTACHDILAMSLGGYSRTSLYEGSWSDWARDTNLPATLGDKP